MMSGKTGTFKVVTNRADKTLEKNSMQISAEIGGRILASNKNLKVDIKSPDHVLDIDIRENKETYMYASVIQGVGGMPVGTSGGGLLLLSGGIDSPVAGYMVAKRGVNVSAVHFHSYPYTSNFAREKVEDLAKIIAPYTNGLTIYMVSMTELQEQIHAHCDDSYMITLLRRGMFTIAERLCKRLDITVMSLFCICICRTFVTVKHICNKKTDARLRHLFFISLIPALRRSGREWVRGRSR